MSTIEIILTVFCLVLALLVWRVLDEVQAVRYRTNRLMKECNVSFFPKVKMPPPPEWIKERTVTLKGLEAENERLKDQVRKFKPSVSAISSVAIEDQIKEIEAEIGERIHADKQIDYVQRAILKMVDFTGRDPHAIKMHTETVELIKKYCKIRTNVKLCTGDLYIFGVHVIEDDTVPKGSFIIK